MMCCLFFKQKTAYEMRISDWSSDVCSSDLGEMLKAGHRNLSTPSQLLMPEGKPEPVIAEAVVRTRNPLKSIAELGPMVRDARKAMKMNQAEFAAHAGVGRRFVSELEGGKPRLEFDKVLACTGAADRKSTRLNSRH